MKNVGRNARGEREAEVAGTAGFPMALLDLERADRCGAPEAVFAQGKTPAEVVEIAAVLVEKQGHALITRASEDKAAAVLEKWPDARTGSRSSSLLVGKPPRPGTLRGEVVVALAGTSDLPVAEEAALTLAAVGSDAKLVADIGVAGLHRLLRRVGLFRRADVIIAVAGMEGALPGVIAGLVACPVIAVPTSVGYGASFRGLSALLGMLNSCSPGTAVVNIDNGFGAAILAARILAGRRARRGRKGGKG